MKCALVTGGSRGIGRAICLKLAMQGYSILVNHKNNDEEANKTIGLIEEKNGKAQLLKFDVADLPGTDRVLGGWMEAHPEDTIEVLVNNAGAREDALLMWMTHDHSKNGWASSLTAL